MDPGRRYLEYEASEQGSKDKEYMHPSEWLQDAARRSDERLTLGWVPSGSLPHSDGFVGANNEVRHRHRLRGMRNDVDIGSHEHREDGLRNVIVTVILGCRLQAEARRA